MLLWGDEALTADWPEICEQVSKAVGADGQPGKANTAEAIFVMLNEGAK